MPSKSIPHAGHPWRNFHCANPATPRVVAGADKILLFKRGRKWLACFKGQTASAAERYEEDLAYNVFRDYGKFDALEILRDAFPEFSKTPYVFAAP